MIERPAHTDWAWYEKNGLSVGWCACCGRFGHYTSPGTAYGLLAVQGWNGDVLETQGRCQKHVGRNPCAIEGCTRTTSAEKVGYALDQWLCSHHWRTLVPPRGRTRRAYRRFWAIKRRTGWSEERQAQFWRFWALLVRQARRRHGGGHLDIAEIERFLASL